MNDPIVDPKEALAHIRMLTENIGRYLVSKNRDDTAAADFVDDAHNLAGLLTALAYTTLPTDFFAAIKSV